MYHALQFHVAYNWKLTIWCGNRTVTIMFTLLGPHSHCGSHPCSLGQDMFKVDSHTFRPNPARGTYIKNGNGNGSGMHECSCTVLPCKVLMEAQQRICAVPPLLATHSLMWLTNIRSFTSYILAVMIYSTGTVEMCA